MPAGPNESPNEVLSGPDVHILPMLKGLAVVIIVLALADQLMWGGQFGVAATKMGWSMLQWFRFV